MGDHIVYKRRTLGGGLAMPEPDLTVVIPCRNEAGTIERCLRRLAAVFPQDAEFLVVDGGSDQTREVVESVAEQLSCLRYIANPNDRGKGHAIRCGTEAARGELIAQIDADLQFLPEDLPRLLEPLQSGQADVALGTRFAPGAVREPGSVSAARHTGNRVISLYASLLFRHGMTDILAGIKAWRRSVTELIHLTSDHYSYEAEIPVRALAAGLRVVDVPITTSARADGASNVRVLSAGARILWDITCFRMETWR